MASYAPMDVLETASCLNCSRPLTGPYCASCGQKKQATDLTLREFLHETTHELTNWDGKIPNTLKTLFFKPGVLTVDFLAGRRARWLSPLRLYLLCSLAFFVSKPIAETISQRSLRGVAKVGITNTDGRAALTPEELDSLENGLPARIFGRDRLLRAAANNAQLNREIEASLPKAMFILLPAFAGLTMLAWRRRLRRYPAHLYLALHLHSAWFGALAVLTMVEAFVTSEVVLGLIGFAMFVYSVAYALLAARRIFCESWVRTLVKAFAIAVAYSVCLAVVTLSLLGYVITKM
jgi:small-conductance mechanosensitive channel